MSSYSRRRIYWAPYKTRDFDFRDALGVSEDIKNWPTESLFTKETTIPTTVWAWRFVVLGNGGGTWIRDLVLSAVDPTLRENSSLVSVSPGWPVMKEHFYSAAAHFPPELFKNICWFADGQSSSFRLVSKYWEQQCRHLIFPEITLRQSPQRVCQLWDAARHPTPNRCIQYVRRIKGTTVPVYHAAEAEFPFLHLIGQVGIPVDYYVQVEGPSREQRWTMSSIHFAVPRSLPSSFSRGIINLSIEAYFRRFEDLTRLISELPDLRSVRCIADFGSFPTELPRRRPRRSRSQLEAVTLESHSGTAECACSLLHLFWGIYSSAAFFSEDEVAVVLALLQFMPTHGALEYNSGFGAAYDHDPENTIRLFEIHNWDGVHVTLQTRLVSSQDNTTSSTFLYLKLRRHDSETVNWTKIGDACRRLSPPPEFVIGAEDRTNILDFAANVVEKLPSIFRPGAVRYGLKENQQWYQTFLDSDKLEGKGFDYLTDIYP